jgi:hypothetical protein
MSSEGFDGHHFWVELKYVPVTVEEKADGSLDVFASEEGLQASEEGAAYGCWFCHTPLKPETLNTGCQPDDRDHP